MIQRLLIAVKIGFAEIFNNKLRSGLSMFAIAVGVVVFLFVFSSVAYTKGKLKRAMFAGENSVTFYLTNSTKVRLKMQDLKEINEIFSDALIVSPTSEDDADPSRFDGIAYSVNYRGITPEYTKTNRWVYTNLQGRMITWDDIINRRRVAVYVRDPLSNKDKTSYWHRRERNGIQLKAFKWELGGKEMLGRKIRMGSTEWTVVGVVDAPRVADDPRFYSFTYDLFLPISTITDISPWNNRFYSIEVVFANKVAMEEAIRRFSVYLAKRFDAEEDIDFTADTFMEISENQIKASRKRILIISILGAIAMISGGIGIMNVVLATIFARTKEIGTRRALGASKLDIFMQFSLESVILSLIGACFGLLASFYLMDWLGRLLDMPTKMSVMSVGGAFFISAATGFIFALYPSLKAANMNPVDALKVE